jgi:hypothetical protein
MILFRDIVLYTIFLLIILFNLLVLFYNKNSNTRVHYVITDSRTLAIVYIMG